MFQGLGCGYLRGHYSANHRGLKLTPSTSIPFKRADEGE